MFTGLVFGVARVFEIVGSEIGIVFYNLDEDSVKIGDSIAINGCCLTVLRIKKTKDGEFLLWFYVLNASFEITNLKYLKSSYLVNYELAMKATDRFGGHVVLGHIDCTAKIKYFENHNSDIQIEVFLNSLDYIILKGSITIDGISLTIAQINKEKSSILINIIPETWTKTNLHAKNEVVNIEFDHNVKTIFEITNKIINKRLNKQL